jgi:hypothetical protein
MNWLHARLLPAGFIGLAVFAMIASGCGPGVPPGKEGFTDDGFVDEGTDTVMIEPDLGSDTETGDEECAVELVESGNVSIDSVEKLELLAGVTVIEGNVELTGSFGELENGLEQLSCLREIGGFVWAHDHDLRDFTGLERLKRIGGYFYVGQSFDLQNFVGLSGLRQIGGYFHVLENFGLQSLDGLDLLVDVGDFVIVSNNPSLTNINGLSGLPGTNGQLRIESNQALENLDGLANMIGISGDLGVLDNQSLTNTTGLQGVQAIAGDVLFTGNPLVWTLNLDSVQTIDGALALSNMPALESLDDLFGLQGINNGLFLLNTGLFSIDGLADLVFLGGTIWIEGNGNLTNIDGLSSLTESFGWVRIDGNPSLVSTAGLGNLQIAHDWLSIAANPNLQVLGLTSLEVAAGNFRVYFTGLPAIDPMPNLTTVGGSLLILENANLGDVSGFSNLQTIGGDLDVRLNPSLANVDGFESLSEVFGRVQFIENDGLVNLNGLGNLQLAHDVNLLNNFLLSNVAGLSGLSQVPGFFRLIGSHGLSNLTGLNNLASVGQDFRIVGCSNLAAIPGLQALNAVGGDVTIANNNDLATCIAQALVDDLAVIGGSVDISGNMPDACGG